MIKWRKYNGALIPQYPPHFEIEIEEEDILRITEFSQLKVKTQNFKI